MATSAPEKQNETKPEQLSEKPAEVKPVAELEPSDPRAEIKRYVEAFGDKGAIWFAEGLDFEGCRNRQIAELQSANDELRKSNDELRQRLSVPKPEGEGAPVELNTGDEKKKTGFAGKINVVTRGNRSNK